MMDGCAILLLLQNSKEVDTTSMFPCAIMFVLQKLEEHLPIPVSSFSDASENRASKPEKNGGFV